MTGSVRVGGPADLIEVVPYLLGFAPTESTVVLGLTGSQVTVTARVDLAAGESAAAGVLRQLLDQTERTVMVFYTEQPVPQWVRQPSHLLSEALLVTGGRWYSLLCADPGCCPPEGHPVRSTPSEVSATAVSLGLAPATSRDTLVAELAPVTWRDAANLTLVEDATSRATELTPTAARDAAWLELERFLGDEPSLRALADYYLEAARHCPQDQRAAAPWFLYAWAQWRLGNGARAAIALGYLDSAAPNHSAAELLRHAMQAAIDPRITPSMADLHRDRLRESVAEALDEAHLPWTRDEASYTVAGCSVALNYATGLPEIWQVERDADVDRVAEALADVHVAPRGSAS
jgi:hypothetical protein